MKQVTLQINTNDVTVGTLVDEMSRAVAYAKSKGAPDDAVLQVEVSELEQRASASPALTWYGSCGKRTLNENR